MDTSILKDVKTIVRDIVGSEMLPDPLDDDFPLVGNVLDSMAITNLIIGIEEHFGFVFSDDELTAEAFSTPATLAGLVAEKTSL